MGLVLPLSILEIFVGSTSPSILETRSSWVRFLDNLTLLILEPMSFKKNRLFHLTYLTSQKSYLYLFILMPYMAITITFNEIH